MVVLNWNRLDETGEGAKPPKQNDQENDETSEVSEVYDEDVERLHTQLDQLNSALDVLEQKNENIQARLLELLKNNKDSREGEANDES